MTVHCLKIRYRFQKKVEWMKVWGFYFKDTFGLEQSSHASTRTGPEILLDKQRVVAPQFPTVYFSFTNPLLRVSIQKKSTNYKILFSFLLCLLSLSCQ